MKPKTILILFVIFVCSSFRIQQKTLETGWYFITDNKVNGITFEDKDSHENFTVERIPILSVIDFKNVKLSKDKMSGFEYQQLKFKLNSKGFRKWDAATDLMSKTNRSAIFVFENEVYCHMRVSHKTQYISPSIVDNNLDSNKLEKIYNSMPEGIKK